MDYAAIKKAAEAYGPAMTKFLRDMIAIPSESCQEKDVVYRIKQEMESLGYDKVEIDGLGNVIGWMGDGDKIIAVTPSGRVFLCDMRHKTKITLNQLVPRFGIASAQSLNKYCLFFLAEGRRKVIPDAYHTYEGEDRT